MTPPDAATLAAHRARVLVAPAALAAELRGPAPPRVVAVQSVNIYTGADSREAGLWLPGAVDAEVFEDFAGPPTPAGGHRPLPDPAALQAAIRRLGLDADRPVVVYDADRQMTAARAWWVLRWAGLGDVRVLDGGLRAWRAAGLPTQESPSVAEPSAFVLRPGGLPEIDADGALRLAAEGVLLDARIRPNYVGGAVEGGDPARGHIPGALSSPAADALTDQGTFADAPTLAEMFAGQGADGSAPVGVYCGAGMSAAVTVLALASVGVPAALYVGSWSQWTGDPAHPGRPVRRGARP